MNTATRDSLKKLCDSIANLANAVVLITGVETASGVMNAAYDVIHQLDKDETIKESR